MLNPGVTISVPSYGSDAYTGISPMNEEETTVSTPIELLDIFVRWCQENDMKIVLDNHSRAADGFLNEELWYTDQYSEQRWIDDWIFMANRYKNFSAVVGMDLNNEPHGSSWGNSNPATDWNKAAERCGNAILKVNPDVLIIVEGVGEFEGNSYWWGGQLMGARKYPVQLSDPSKLVYSAHEYGPEVAPQDWFTAPNFPQNMPEIWRDNFHYLYEEEVSPIFAGEFGIKDQDAFGGISFTWFTEYTDFMGDIYSWTFWSMNPNSGDTGGILKDDWSSVNQWKLDVLQPHMAPLIPNVINGPVGNRPPVARFSADRTSGTDPLTVSFDASSSSDPDNDALTYSWDFGDNTSASGVSVSHVFNGAGSYRVALTVSDGALSATQTLVITVSDNTPAPAEITAAITASAATGVAPATINFDASGSSSSDGSALSFSWNFGDTTTATGNEVSHVYANPGTYVVRLTATNAAGVSDTATQNITITAPPTTPTPPTGGNDCDFGAPLANALPTIANVAYSNIYVLGNGGPDLSNVTNFTINWDLANNGLWQFSMNTNNGSPSWWNNLLTNITSQSFNTPEPSVTLANTGFSGLDGAYYAAQDGDNFALVSIDGNFTIYFSNSATGPSCQSALKSYTSQDTLQIQTFPNPVQDQLTIRSTTTLSRASMKLVDISGRMIKTIELNSRTNQIQVNTSSLQQGIYFIQIHHKKQTEVIRFIKK